MIVMIAFGMVLALATALLLAIVLQRRFQQKRVAELEVEEEPEPPVEPLPAAVTPKKKKARRKPGDDPPEEAARANLPEIKNGARCWHRKAKEWCRVVKVYYDDHPPYYSVQMADGSERATVRARLETEEEHAVEVAATERAKAEKAAEKAAAALLAEEAQPRRSERRPQTSGGRGETSAKKRR